MKKKSKISLCILSIITVMLYMVPMTINANPVIDPPLPDLNSSVSVNADNEPDPDAGDTVDPVLPNCQYCTHLEGIGWDDWLLSDEISGTVGEGRRMEAVGIVVTESDYNLGIEYQSFVENFGWLGIRADGQGSGTSGYGLRLEAIHINLTGEDAELFDVYYQVHAQNYGWLDWAKNGEDAGTCDLGLRLEAIRIIILPAGSEAPGETDTPFIQG